jgi:hypothetical protein
MVDNEQNPASEPVPQWRMAWDVYTSTGVFAQLDDDLEVAEECHTLAAMVALDGKDAQCYAQSMTSLAAVLLRLHRYDEASLLIDAALQVRTTTLHPLDIRIAETVQLKASLEYSLKNYEASADLFMQAMRGLCSLPDDHALKLQTARNFLRAKEMLQLSRQPEPNDRCA